MERRPRPRMHLYLRCGGDTAEVFSGANPPSLRSRFCQLALTKTDLLSAHAFWLPQEGEAVPQRDFWCLAKECLDGGAELLASGARDAWGRTAGGCLRSLWFAHRTGRAVDGRLGQTCSAVPASWAGGRALPGEVSAAARASTGRAGAELGSPGRTGERARQVRAAVPVYRPCASRMEFSSSSLIARPKPSTTATARGWFRLLGARRAARRGRSFRRRF